VSKFLADGAGPLETRTMLCLTLTRTWRDPALRSVPGTICVLDVLVWTIRKGLDAEPQARPQGCDAREGRGKGGQLD
jgi:hypothetical protein